MKQIKNNTLIACYMGQKESNSFTINEDGSKNPGMILTINDKEYQYYLYPTKHFSDIRILKFHESWEWLMPVVLKITGEYHEFMCRESEGEPYCEILCYKEGKLNKQITVEDFDLFKTIYKAVIKFIKWHNKCNHHENL